MFKFNAGKITINARALAQKLWPDMPEEEQARRVFVAQNGLDPEADLSDWGDFSFSEDGYTVLAKFKKPVDCFTLTLKIDKNGVVTE